MISPIRNQESVLVLPLRDGERMSVEEFERRWEAMPDLKRAELIEGRVYMNAAALRWDWHAEPYGILMLALAFYGAYTPGALFGTEPSVRMEEGSLPQPDGVLRISEEFGGQTKIEGGFVVGGPELVAEISASSERHDLGVKKDLYFRCGVREYLNWSVLEERIVLFHRDADQFVELNLESDGMLKSRVFPGLWLDPTAMIQHDRLRVIEVLQLGIQSSEHQAFVKELEQRRTQTGGQP